MIIDLYNGLYQYWPVIIGLAILAIAYQIAMSSFLTIFGRGRRSWPRYILDLIVQPWSIAVKCLASGLICLLVGIGRILGKAAIFLILGGLTAGCIIYVLVAALRGKQPLDGVNLCR